MRKGFGVSGRKGFGFFINFSCIILSIALICGFSGEASAGGAARESTKTPWEFASISLDSGSCYYEYVNATNNLTNVFYSSPDAGIEDVLNILGGEVDDSYNTVNIAGQP